MTPCGAAFGRLLALGTHAPLGVTVACALGAIGAVHLGTLIGPVPRPAPAAREIAAVSTTTASAALGLLLHPVRLVAGHLRHDARDRAHHVGLGRRVAAWHPPTHAAAAAAARSFPTGATWTA